MAAINTYDRRTSNLSTATIETERLRLRPFAEKDAQAFWQMRSNPDVMRWIPMDTATDKANVVEEFHQALKAGERFKFFNAVEWRSPPPGKEGFMIGWVLFRPTEDGRFVELGYWFLPEAWGQGLATEAAAAMVEGHRETVGVPLADIYAEAYIGNDGSRRVLEKVGLTVSHEGDFDGQPTWVFYWKSD